VKGTTYYEKFSNSNVSGRTGRGDTTFSPTWPSPLPRTGESLKSRRPRLDQDGRRPPLQGNAGGCPQRIKENTRAAHELTSTKESPPGSMPRRAYFTRSARGDRLLRAAAKAKVCGDEPRVEAQPRALPVAETI
jgi:hypothetical protein